MRRLPASIWFISNVLTLLVALQFRASLPRSIWAVVAFWPFAIVPLAYALFAKESISRSTGWVISVFVFVGIVVARFIS